MVKNMDYYLTLVILKVIRTFNIIFYLCIQ